MKECFKLLAMIEDVCILAVDDKGKILFYSKGCEKAEGYRSQEVVGRHVNAVYYEAKTRQDQKSHSQIMKTLKTGQAIHSEMNVYSTEHKKKIVSLGSTYPILGKNGGIEMVICVYREISDYLDMLSVINKQRVDIASHNRELSNGTIYTFDSIIGKNEKLLTCIDYARRAAQTEEPVLLCGETGTGKELFAQGIHNAGKQRARPFGAVNCASIPENLLESTLFGTQKGSFTGAVNAKGLIEEAEGGTLFLDEVNSMNSSMQSKLLRVLETGRYRRVGETKERRCTIRIISAMNENPYQAIQEKRIREDFFYRLSAFIINIPPLRERKDDILELTDHFISQMAPVMGKKAVRLSEKVKRLLVRYPWPGNIRELRHLLHQAVSLMHLDERLIQEEHLPEYFREMLSKTDCREEVADGRQSVQDLKAQMNRYEKKLILSALKQNKQNVTHTAKQLKITRQSLHDKMRRLGI